MSFPELLWIFLKASTFSSGGLQALPLLQEDLIQARGILTEADFAKAVSIGRITPGPNGLFVLSIGYFAAGVPGVIAALIGVTAPPFLAIGLVRMHRRLAGRAWVIGATRGVTATGVGLLVALGYSFSLPLIGHPASIGIGVVSLGILVLLKADALPVLVAGAVAGIGFHLLGVPLA